MAIVAEEQHLELRLGYASGVASKGSKSASIRRAAGSMARILSKDRGDRDNCKLGPPWSGQKNVLICDLICFAGWPNTSRLATPARMPPPAAAPMPSGIPQLTDPALTTCATGKHPGRNVHKARRKPAAAKRQQAHDHDDQQEREHHRRDMNLRRGGQRKGTSHQHPTRGDDEQETQSSRCSPGTQAMLHAQERETRSMSARWS